VAARAAAAAARTTALAKAKTAREARIKKDEKILSKLREGAHEARRKAVQEIENNEKKIYSKMWMKMSAASQSSVREEEGFEDTRLSLDCMRLASIRATHLTHIFGAGDSMKVVNALEQEIRFSTMRQGDREFMSTFKTRFDNQVRANEGAGVPRPTDRKLALEFIMKLDPKRYMRMLSQMRNDSLLNDVDAYPSTLVASAFRIASGWTNEDPSSDAYGIENNSAYLADACFVPKAKDPEKGCGGKTPGTDGASKTKRKAEIICFVCGLTGHFARECSQRK
jgi:Zinc knuckle